MLLGKQLLHIMFSSGVCQSINLIQKLLNQRSLTIFSRGIEPFSALYNNLKPLQININQPNQLYPFPLNF